MASPREALDMLRADPETFLKNYYIICYQGGGSGQLDYCISATGYTTMTGREVYNRTPRPGSILGTTRMHNSKNFKFAPANNIVAQAGFVGAREDIRVWHIDVVHSNTINVNAIPYLQVTGGPDIMVTTLLNGCTFVCEGMGNSVLMAHIRPRGGQDGATLAGNIGAGGHFNGSVLDVSYYGANGPTRGVHLGYDSHANDVTVVGVRIRNSWQVFAQKHTGNTRYILSVTRFFHD